jgi:predicted RNA-binding Zn ribbon-like protein
VLDLEKRPAFTVHLIGGRLCLDFVNSIGARRIGPAGKMVIRDEKLNDFFDAIAWAQHAGVFTRADARKLAAHAQRSKRAAAREFRELIDLREALYRILKATFDGRTPRDGDLLTLNGARKLRRVVANEKGFDLRWDERIAFDTLRRAVAESAVEYLTSADLTRLSRCGGDDCGWLFEDVSRNRSRAWCDTRDCGNRARVRRFRRRRG